MRECECVCMGVCKSVSVSVCVCVGACMGVSMGGCGGVHGCVGEKLSQHTHVFVLDIYKRKVLQREVRTVPPFMALVLTLTALVINPFHS